MVRLYDNDSDSEIGQITEAQLDFLQEELLEESIDSYTYNLSSAAIDSLALNGADADLLEMLRKALGTRPSIEIRYDLG